MKVKIQCHKCKKIFKTRVYTMKAARGIKRSYKEGKFTCWFCMNIKDGVYGIGILS